MSSETQKILTTDGIPLEISLKKAEKKNKIKAFLLVAPLLLFIIITYIFPIGEMFTRSIDDRMVTNMLPKTFKAMETWDGKELPPEKVFAAFLSDFKVLAEKKEHGKLGQRLNKEKGYTFCMIEHDIDFISRLCDPVIVMAEGSVLFEGTSDEVKKNDRVIESYLGRRSITEKVNI